MAVTDEWRNGRITDEGIAELVHQIGVREEIVPWISTASEDAIWHFALGVGDDNPLWWDRRYAESGSPGRMYAPPTLLYAAMTEVRKPGMPPRTSGAEGSLKGTLSLWAGDRWIWHDRIWVDERISATRELHSVRETAGSFAGRSIAQTELYRFHRRDGGLIAELYRTLLRFERQASRTNGKYLEVPPAAYTAQDRQAIVAQYAEEAGRRRGPQARYWEDVQVGDEIAPIVKGPLTITNLVGWLLGWGSPQCPTNRMLYSWLAKHPGGLLHNPATGIDDTLEAAHWEEHFARESGMARGYDFGGQRIAWVAHLLTDWCGDEGELRALDARLRAPNYLGDTTWLTARVTGKRQGELGPLVDCHVLGVNQRDETTIIADATVSLPARKG